MPRQLGELIARGTRSAVYAYGSDAVLKVPDAATPSAWIEREAEYSALVREAGAPAPRLLGVERREGRAASVWEHVPGPSMWQCALREPGRSAEYGALLARLQLGLFALVPPVLLPRQRDRLLSKIRAAAEIVGSTYAEVSGRVPESTGPPRLCHGDLHPGNVILSATGPVIVDWFDVSNGDALADIARSGILMRLGGDGDAPGHLPGAGPATLGPLAEAYLATLRAHMEIPPSELERWGAVEAVARVAEGVPAAALIDAWEAGRWAGLSRAGPRGPARRSCGGARR